MASKKMVKKAAAKKTVTKKAGKALVKPKPTITRAAALKAATKTGQVVAAVSMGIIKEKDAHIARLEAQLAQREDPPAHIAMCPILELLSATPAQRPEDDPHTDLDSHWSNTPLAEIPDFAANVTRYDLVRGHLAQLEAEKERLAGEIKTHLQLTNLVDVDIVAMGFAVKVTETEGKKSLDRMKLAEAGVTEEQLIKGTVTGKAGTRISVVAFKETSEGE